MSIYSWKRNRHKRGDYLMRDDESGIVHYASDMVRRWDGHFVHHTQNETRNPQEFVVAKPDPKPLKHISEEPLIISTIVSATSGMIV